MALHRLYTKGIRKSIQLYFLCIIEHKSFTSFYFNLRLINHSKGMHIPALVIRNSVIIFVSKPTELHSDGPATLFNDAESFWFSLSLLLLHLSLSIPLPCLYLTVHFFFTCFSVFSLPFPSSPLSGPFPSFGLLVNFWPGGFVHRGPPVLCDLSRCCPSPSATCPQ